MEWIFVILKSQQFWTVITGVLVFCLCQLFSENILQPIKKYHELKGKVSYCLTYYANLYSNPLYKGQKYDDQIAYKYSMASDEMRKLAAELRAYLYEKPRLLVGVPSRKKIYDVSKNLIGLANSLYITEGHENEDRKSIRKCINAMKKNMKFSMEEK